MKTAPSDKAQYRSIGIGMLARFTVFGFISTRHLEAVFLLLESKIGMDVLLYTGMQVLVW